MKTNCLTFSILILLAIALVACGGAPQAPETVEDAGAPLEDEVASGEGVSAVGSESADGENPFPPDTGPKVEITRVVVETEAIVEAPRSEAGAVEIAVTPLPMATPSPAVELSAALDSGDSAALTLDQESRLTAGEQDDNKNWDDYLLYIRNYSGATIIEVDVSERHQIWVTDAQSGPVLGARIGIEADGQEVAVLRTHSDGKAYFFPKALDRQAETYQVNVVVDDTVESFTIPAGGTKREWYVSHPGAGRTARSAQLDVLFLIDATGSMADEINELKENIRSIAAQIDALPARPTVRFGLVSYRDRGDEYVTRMSDFTPDVEQFAGILAEVDAAGGGDYPEDLNEALSQAVHRPEWRVDDTVSLIFLVADAPPHLDYQQQNHYAAEIFEANRLGIKIYPIASSGLDSQGEYVFRQMAQVTGGRFIFLTYGAEGPGTTGTETDFEVSDYTVASLDALVVRIVEEELSHLVQ